MSAPRDPVEFRSGLGIRPFSPAWRTTLKAFYGTPLEPDERALFRELSGGVEERPGAGWTELLANVGRGGGKDDAIKTVVHFECRHGGHEIAAAPGQRLPVLVICPLTNQAKGMLRLIQGEAQLGPKRELARNTDTAVEFRNGLVAQVTTCDAVAVVGDTVPLAVRNEWALFPGDESPNSDTLIDNNLRPALRQIAGAPPHRLIGITSSYTRDSLAWKTFSENYGKSEDVLVVRGSTEVFNPNIDKAWLARERRRLGARAAAMHFDCEWVDAVQEGWFGPDVIDRSIDRERKSSPPDRNRGFRYTAAIDAAFRGDQFALAIAHREHEKGSAPRTVLDGVWMWRAGREGSLNVRSTVAECAQIIGEYGATAFADQFAFDPLRELFQARNVWLREAPWTAATKPQRFSRIRHEMASGTIRLCDDPALVREFHSIRGQLLRSGGERLEARAGHDDLVHAAVLALYFAADRDPDFGESNPYKLAASRPGRRYAETYEQRVAHFLNDGGRR